MPKDSPKLPRSLKEIAKEDGFVRLPPLYVRYEDIPEVHKIAEKYDDRIRELRQIAEKEYLDFWKAKREETAEPEEEGPYQPEEIVKGVFDPLAADWPGMN
jgi:hypothetical protein